MTLGELDLVLKRKDSDPLIRLMGLLAVIRGVNQREPATFSGIKESLHLFKKEYGEVNNRNIDIFINSFRLDMEIDDKFVVKCFDDPIQDIIESFKTTLP